MRDQISAAEIVGSQCSKQHILSSAAYLKGVKFSDEVRSQDTSQRSVFYPYDFSLEVHSLKNIATAYIKKVGVMAKAQLWVIRTHLTVGACGKPQQISH